MEWTKENPTQSGFYWLRTPSETVMVNVYADDEEFYYTGNDQAVYFDETVNAEWFGPLEPPE